MLHHVTAVLLGGLFTFLWLQFKDLNIIRPNLVPYVRCEDVMLIYLMNIVFVIGSWCALSLIPGRII